MLVVQKVYEFVNVRVEDWLAHQAQRAVSDAHCFCEALGPDTGDPFQHFDFLVMALLDAFEHLVCWVHLPAPCCSHRICPVAPAEDAFIAA